MKLTMNTNLGIIDAKRFNIAQANQGDTIDVDGAAAEELIRRGWAAPFTASAPDIKAIPPAADLKSAPRGATTTDKAQA